MSQTHKPQVDIEEEIMTAIDLCGSEGASLDDIQRYLQSTLKNNVPDLESIQSSLNNAVTEGLLLKLENGKYKIKSATERAEKDDEDDDEEEDDNEEEEEQDEDDDDDEYEVEIMTAIDLCGSEGASLDDIQQYLKSTLKNNVPDLESIQSNLNNAFTEGLLLKLENGKYKIKSATERAEKDDEDGEEEEEDENEEEEEQDEEEEDDDEYEVEIMTAIDLCGPEGASLDNIQQYLKSTLKNNVPDLESIQSNLNNAVTEGLLLKLENGKYKIKSATERAEKDDEDGEEEEEDENEEEEEQDEEEEDDDEYEVEIMTAIDLCGPEGASLDDIQQYLKSTLKNNIPDLESIQSNLNNAVAKEFLLELDNGKYNIKYYAEPEEEEADNDEEDENDDDDEDENDDDDEEDENDDDDDDDEDYEEYGEDEENAQEVERSVDKVSKDANRNADSDTGNADSSKAEEDANV